MLTQSDTHSHSLFFSLTRTHTHTRTLSLSLSHTHRNSLIVLWSTDNGDGFWQHELVGAVSVQVNTGQERRLRRVGLETKHTGGV